MIFREEDTDLNFGSPPFRPDGGEVGGVIDYVQAADDLFARFTTPPSEHRKVLINTAIKALQEGGVWSELDWLHLFAAANAQAAQRNWLQDLYNCTLISTPTFLADRYYAGDGATTGLSTNFNPTTAASPKFTQDNASMGVWILNDVNEDKSEVGNTNALVRGRRGATLLPGYRANEGTTRNGAAITDATGMTSWSRNSAGETKIYKNGALNATNAFASTALSNENILACTSGAGLYSTKQIACIWAGAKLNDAQQAVIYNAVRNYLIGVGAVTA